jgi:hypothetical protein
MAKVTVNPPKTPVTEGSNGLAAATLPNVCKMPGPPAPFIPTPLPNIGKSGNSPKDYSETVTIEGHKVAIKGATFKSMGDSASQGTGGGLISSNVEGPTSFVGPGSMNVKIEGKNVQLLSDPMLNNGGPSGSPPNAATMVGLIQATGLAALVGDETCPLCGKAHGDDGKLEESPETKGDADKLTEAAERAVKRAKALRDERAAEEKAEYEKIALEEYQREKAALEASLEAARGKAPAGVIAGKEQKIAALKPKPFTRSSLPEASMSRMLGVVRCRDDQTYAGTSKYQLSELYEEIPGGWHTPFTSTSILGKPPDPAERRAGFLKHVKAKDKFADRWEETERLAAAFNDASEAGLAMEPHYPPGQCAGQQVVRAALDHGGRPVGMTERWYKSGDDKATVTVFFRDSPAAEPRPGQFGGKAAVPPCGTCQIILTMLLCPDERPLQCAHQPLDEEVCKCNPPKKK